MNVARPFIHIYSLNFYVPSAFESWKFKSVPYYVNQIIFFIN